MKWRGRSTKGVDRTFLRKVAAAAKAQGATYIYVTSGKRTPETNTGVSNSNHLYGHAIDGYAYIPGRGKVPLGTLLKASAPQYGLRSGDQANFYKGAPDPSHVDDGYNVHGGHPLPASQPIDTGTTGTTDTTAPTTVGPDVALQNDIAGIPQLPGPAQADVALAGTFDQQPAQPTSVAQTWQLIASNGEVSPETLRLAGMAGYGNGEAPSG